MTCAFTQKCERKNRQRTEAKRTAATQCGASFATDKEAFVLLTNTHKHTHA